MNLKNQHKLKQTIDLFNKYDLLYIVLDNGQIQVDGINYWATTERWYDPKNGRKGQGINSFINYLRDKEILYVPKGL